MIRLTQVQADEARGVTSNGHALDPVATYDKDGKADSFFILPERVLEDKAHQHKHEELRKYTKAVLTKKDLLSAAVRSTHPYKGESLKAYLDEDVKEYDLKGDDKTEERKQRVVSVDDKGVLTKR